MIVADPDIQLAVPLLLLLNGGEETILTAAHGFMKTSKWAPSVGAFINLESTGPAGPDVLFQHTGIFNHPCTKTKTSASLNFQDSRHSSCKNSDATCSLRMGCLCAPVTSLLRAGSWTLEAYARGAKYPHGSAFGQVCSSSWSETVSV